ncbi:MAG: GAF domain-containing protein [Candidatus Eremiobacteraeota bacterium]|nr:GAF domain-containing protein [Candidatus Eremiobacteraeota bacterium]
MVKKSAPGRDLKWLVRIADIASRAKSIDSFQKQVTRNLAELINAKRVKLGLQDEEKHACLFDEKIKCPLGRKKPGPIIDCTLAKPVENITRACFRISQKSTPYGILLIEWKEKSPTVDVRELEDLLIPYLSMGLQRLYVLEESRRKMKEVTSLYSVLSYEFSAAITTLTDLEEVLEKTMEAVGNFLEAERVSIMLLDRKRRKLLLRSQWSRDDEKFAIPRLRLGEGVAGWAAKHGKSCVMEGPDDPRYIPPLPGLRELKSLLSVPMKVQDRVIGVINVASIYRERKFTTEEIRALELIAGRAALALENAILLEKIKDDAEEQKRLNRQLRKKTAQLEEHATILKLLNEKLKENIRGRHLLLEFSQSISRPGLGLRERMELVPETAVKIFNLEIAGIIRSKDGGEIEIVSVRGPRKSYDLTWMNSFLFDLVKEASKTALPVQATGKALEKMATSDFKNLLVARLLSDEHLYLFMGSKETVWDEDAYHLLGIFLGNSALSLENAMVLERERIERQKVASIVEGLGEGVIVVDRDRKVVMINPAGEKVTGWSSEEAIGRFCGELFRGSDPEGTDRCYNRCPLLSILKFPGTKRKEIAAEGWIENRHGEKILVSSIHAPLIIDGIMQGGVIVFRDITGERELQKEKMDFLAGISHDIKNPLASIKGYSMTLLRFRHKLSEKEQDEYLRIITSEIDHLNRLLDNMIELSRVESEVLKVKQENIEPEQMIQRIFNLYRIISPAHEFKLKKEGKPLVFADPILLYQILDNLISNAVKYSPGGGEILVGIKPSGKKVKLWVEDEGAGIPPDEMESVFERYKRGKGKSTKKITGKGLGLYITKKLLEKMQGDISVKNRKGGGARFVIHLPGVSRPCSKGDRS